MIKLIKHLFLILCIAVPCNAAQSRHATYQRLRNYKLMLSITQLCAGAGIIGLSALNTRDIRIFAVAVDEYSIVQQECLYESIGLTDLSAYFVWRTYLGNLILALGGGWLIKRAIANFECAWNMHPTFIQKPLSRLEQCKKALSPDALLAAGSSACSSAVQAAQHIVNQVIA